MPDAPALFALEASRPLAEAVASRLDVPLGRHEERAFEDGEHKIRPLDDVEGRDVFVLGSLHEDPQMGVDAKLCRLLFFAGALRDAGAARVTAVVPYLCYARKDRRTKPRDPVTTRYVAALFEAVGVDRVIGLDVHNRAAFQNAFRVPTVHLSARPLFVEYLRTRLGDRDAAVLSPDEGGAKRAEELREALEEALGRPVRGGFLEKKRSEGVVSGQAFVGDVEGCVAILLDDLVASGTTLARAARACRTHGAEAVWAAATHGVFVGDADAAIGSEALDQLLITNSVPPEPRLSEAVLAAKVTTVDASPLLADAIRHLHAHL
ncbi:MAG TPA: ribose-phosphate pyrophosphokinase [Sandaracinaceae bacterium LLY-WYZ-13_1]|nr:ribose-phosphate pyrophosphokinase [Sandaracinaceae bacterium LLY-WYZ-13_1]